MQGNLVAEGKAIDDVGGGASLGGSRYIAHLSSNCQSSVHVVLVLSVKMGVYRLIRVGRVILRDETNNAAAPQARNDAKVASQGSNNARHALDVNGLGKGPGRNRVQDNRHHQRGEAKLDLENSLDILSTPARNH